MHHVSVSLNDEIAGARVTWNYEYDMVSHLFDSAFSPSVTLHTAADTCICLFSLTAASTKREDINTAKTKQVVNSCNSISFRDHGVGKKTILASCLIYAWALPAHPYST